MKKILFIALLSLTISNNELFASETKAPNFVDSYIEKYLTNYHFPKGELNTFIRESLAKEGESTKPWSIIADFNGDKREDWAGLLADKDNNIDVVLIYSSNGKYKHSLLQEGVGEDNNAINVGVYIENPGIVKGFPFDDVPEKDLIANLVFPGIHIVFYETSSVLYYFSGDQIRELWTSD
jgi:hypothetical protein